MAATNNSTRINQTTTTEEGELLFPHLLEGVLAPQFQILILNLVLFCYLTFFVCLPTHLFTRVSRCGKFFLWSLFVIWHVVLFLLFLQTCVKSFYPRQGDPTLQATQFSNIFVFIIEYILVIYAAFCAKYDNSDELIYNSVVSLDGLELEEDDDDEQPKKRRRKVIVKPEGEKEPFV